MFLARDQAIRNSFQYAAQASCRNGVVRTDAIGGECPSVNNRIRLQCKRSHMIYKGFPVFVVVNDLPFFKTTDDDMMQGPRRTQPCLSWQNIFPSPYGEDKTMSICPVSRGRPYLFSQDLSVFT